MAKPMAFIDENDGTFLLGPAPDEEEYDEDEDDLDDGDEEYDEDGDEFGGDTPREINFDDIQ